MKFSSAFLAAVSVGVATAQSSTASSAVQRPSENPTVNAVTSHGCYNANGTSWKIYPVDVTKLSVGKCTDECKTNQKKNVAALNGEDCYCGDDYPPKINVVKDEKCNFGCPAYPLEACGGVEDGLFYSVYNTGIKIVVADEEPATTSASSTAKATTTNAGGAVETIIETPTPPPAETTASDDSKKSGTNVAGIAAGVVVGVVAIAAIVGGIFFYVRRKRNAEIEEEHRRNAAVNAFIGGSKPPSSSGMSMTDSRMDPTLAHRRMSDGSIADNQDYSRKILRVTNA
ncbi:Cell wall integrity and stress response component 1 [Colletotrichum sp. SAR 10_86]|nr:Cell wall integrity and stress response component 1 [Colletotrichum sp. SAR 10_86]KAI8240077.1 Cell wall integrity and stress response component 1 [Colletotrichum sp. SAR 10_96]KAI8259050.1 Cell wall integrity and stress response component 1 [Colletotrichum sp. SAR11_239]KAI8270014.1 Cell wall integrity and stress response component 1 [Colletotrichum sp. SAR 10_98]KAI8295012.1 Cell wall integrity and stress response component 1 [Colletotrichum sp. SAR11_240]KAJ5015143.1 Cell wall integrity 